jgi:hypothetical protein
VTTGRRGGDGARLARAASPRLPVGAVVVVAAAGFVAALLGATRAGTTTQSAPPASASQPAPAPASAPAGPAFLERDDCGIDFVHQRFATPSKKYLVETAGSGVGLFDYDGDGRLDVYCVQCCPLPGGPANVEAPPDVLFHNDGRGADGRFHFSRVPDAVAVKQPDGTTVKRPLGLGDRSYGMSVTCPDVDNDGRPDLFVTNVSQGVRYRDNGNGKMTFVSNGGRDTLYRNNGDGTFTDVTDKSGIVDVDWTGGAAWADLDGDGDLDLYLANYAAIDFDHYQPCGTRERISYCHPDALPAAPDRLFRNDGNFKFVDVTKAAGVVEPGHGGHGLAALPFDWDDDGKLDLYVANDTDPNFLWHNVTGPDGKLRFEETANDAGIAVSGEGRAQACMGSDFADVDGDLRLDLASANLGREGTVLYVRRDGGLFEDRSARSGVLAPTLLYTGFGLRFFDYDRDADMDLMQVNGHVLDDVHDFDASQTFEQVPNFLENRGDGTFAEIGPRLSPFFTEPDVGRGLAVGDLDDDGDLDAVVLENDHRARVLENVLATANHWIGFKLVGTKSPRDAIGARVVLTCGDKRQVQQVTGSSSYFSWQDLRLYFGVGARTDAASATVRWPSGRVETLEKLALDRYHEVVESR